MTQDLVNRIIDYWFGGVERDIHRLPQQSQRWFNGGAAVDAYVTEHFQAYVEPAAQGELESWKQTPLGFLALIIVLDQFPRHIYRHQPQAFAYDAIALSLCLEGIETGIDQSLPCIQRKFFYLPLQHAESLPIQEQSVAYYATLATEAPPEWQEHFKDALKYAEQHREIIKKFGRFLHRDAILGRETSPEELEFLNLPGIVFEIISPELYRPILLTVLYY
jgi:uncharacterized protein (DUF924 family)